MTSSMLIAILINCMAPYVHAETVSSLQNDVEQQNTEISATDKEIKKKQAEISKLNDSVEDVEKELESKQNEITENQEKLEKVQEQINSKEEEIAKLQDDLEEHQKDSSSFLSALQKDANVNYFLEIMSSDSMDTKSKLTPFHGLNILANDSYDMLIQTAKLQKSSGKFTKRLSSPTIKIRRATNSNCK